MILHAILVIKTYLKLVIVLVLLRNCIICLNKTNINSSQNITQRLNDFTYEL